MQIDGKKDGNSFVFQHVCGTQSWKAHIEKISSLFSQLGAEKTGVITYAMYRGHRFPHLIAPSVLFGMQQQPFWIGFL
jgi:hypothetical protein